MSSAPPKSFAPTGKEARVAQGFGRLAYLSRWMPAYFWQFVTRPKPRGTTHLMIALADHFEPAIVPEDGSARAPYHEQERRLERWCLEYPKLFSEWRDAEDRPFVHTYFYPAEQYEPGLVARLAEHCHRGWGEIEVHLHHGMRAPDSPENTRLVFSQFREQLARQHGCLSYWDGSPKPRYAFVHGNFALANSDGGHACGVDSELQVLADTGCYADFTLPTAAFHGAQISKINSIYECLPPLNVRAAHRRGHDLQRGSLPQIFPLIVQGPLMLDLPVRAGRRKVSIENAALNGTNPPSLHRLNLWKRASIAVKGKPDWLFIKLHCHGMDSTHEKATLGSGMQSFLRELITSSKERQEILHFVTAREMVNIILAACDGKDGNPGQYRDYRLKRLRDASHSNREKNSAEIVRG